MTSSVRELDVVGGGEGGSVLTAAVIADVVGGRLIGDPTVVVRGVAPLDRATAADLSFFAIPKYAMHFETTGAGVVLISAELANSPGTASTRVVVDRPHEALLSLVPKLYRTPTREPGVHRTVTIGREAAIGSRVSIGANVVIGDGAVIGDGVVLDPNVTIGAGVRIGDRSHIHPNVTLYSGTTLGSRVIIQAGARIGSDGFGYVFRGGVHERIPHVGRCIIHDDVEIGANTTVDRGSIDDTVIGAGTKIDNLVQIGHNVRIGRLCLIMAHVGISGSAHIEDGCILAGQVGVAGHTTMGKGARIGGQAGVFGDVPPGQTWTGYPARPRMESLRASAALFKLVPYVARIERFFSNQDRDKTE